MSYPCTFTQFPTIPWAPMSATNSSSPHLTTAPHADTYYQQLLPQFHQQNITVSLDAIPVYYSSAISHPMMTTQAIPIIPDAAFVNMQPTTSWSSSESTAILTQSTVSSSPNSPPSTASSPTTLAFPCTLCPKSFNRKNSLRRHLQLHSGVRPYSCTTCKRSFSRQDIYKRHCASRRCQRLTERESIYRMGFEGANLNHAPEDVLERCRNGTWLDHHDPNSDPTLEHASQLYNMH